MSHHLAELVTAAQTDATLEQRVQIIDLILRIWTNRRFLPDPPLAEYEPVLAALERLGNSQPWAFARIRLKSTSPRQAEVPLVATAIELERLVRETVLRLIWMAACDASERNREWLELADEVASNLETEVGTVLDRLRSATGALELTSSGFDDSSGADESPERAVLSDEAHAANLRQMASSLLRASDALDGARGTRADTE